MIQLPDDDVLRSLYWTATFLKAVVFLNDNQLEVPIDVLERLAADDVQLYFDKRGDTAVAILIRPNHQEH